MTTYRAVADLGWTPGADISSALATWISGTAQSGDELILDTTTRFDLTQATSGEITLPANFTLSAVGYDGGGFDIQDTTTSNNFCFIASAGCTFINLTVRAVNAPISGYTGLNPVAGTDYATIRFIECNVANVTVQDCDFEGQIEFWISCGNNCDDLLVQGCRLYGGKYQIYMIGDVYRPRIWGNYFEYGMIDSIKTVMSNASNPASWVGPNSDGIVVNSKNNQFVDTNRECWDTTGGIKNWICENDMTNGAYMDLKHPIKELSDPANDASSVWTTGGPDYGNFDITVNGLYIINSPSPIVITNDTPTGDVISIADYSRINPKRFTFNDVKWKFTSTPTGPRLFYLKGGEGIDVDGLDIYGYSGAYDIFQEDYDAGLGGAGDAPTGWTPTLSNTSANVTQTASAPSPDFTFAGWMKVGESASANSPMKFGSAILHLGGSLLLI